MAEDKYIYYCVGCGKPHPKGSFYVSDDIYHANGVLPYCKKFMKDKSYNKDKSVNINGLKNVLMRTNLPFLYETLESATSMSGDIVGNYFRMLNSLPQNKGLTWNNSDFGTNIKDNVIPKESNIEVIIDDDIKSKYSKKEREDEAIFNDPYLKEEVYSKEWRGTYTRADLAYLDDYYQELKLDFKIVTKNHKDYAKKIAKASLAMDKAYEDMMMGVNGSDKRYKDLKDTFDSLSKSAQFAEDKRGQNDVSLGGYGVTFDKVEQRKWIPTHIPIEKDDLDKLIEYFSTINKSV